MISANPLAPGCQHSSELPLGSAYYNGTKRHFLNLVGVDTTLPELTYIAEAINTKGPFTCDLGQQMVFETSVIIADPTGITPDLSGYTVLRRFYRLLPQLISVGHDGGPIIDPPNLIANVDLMPDGQLTVNPQTEESLFIDLGDIGTTPIEDAFNTGMPAPTAGDPWDINGERFITAILDGTPTIFRWIGGLGLFGGTDAGTDPEINLATSADFDNLSNQPEAAPNPPQATVTPDTSTLVDLSSVFGNYCNQESANSSTSYTVENEIPGGKARILINASSEPSVTGGDILTGSEFAAGQDMYLWIEYNGTSIEYWFEAL